MSFAVKETNRLLRDGRSKPMGEHRAESLRALVATELGMGTVKIGVAPHLVVLVRSFQDKR